MYKDVEDKSKSLKESGAEMEYLRKDIRMLAEEH